MRSNSRIIHLTLAACVRPSLDVLACPLSGILGHTQVLVVGTKRADRNGDGAVKPGLAVPDIACMPDYNRPSIVQTTLWRHPGNCPAAHFLLQGIKRPTPNHAGLTHSKYNTVRSAWSEDPHQLQWNVDQISIHSILVQVPFGRYCRPQIGPPLVPSWWGRFVV